MREGENAAEGDRMASAVHAAERRVGAMVSVYEGEVALYDDCMGNMRQKRYQGDRNLSCMTR